MSYVTQDTKKEVAPAIKAICKKYGITASLSVHDLSTLRLTISKGPIDFFESYNRLNKERCFRRDEKFFETSGCLTVNRYQVETTFDGKARAFLQEIIPVMLGKDFYDKSDSMRDYFDCSRYIDIKIGKWNKDYALLASDV